MKRPTLNQRILAFSREFVKPYNYSLWAAYVDSKPERPWSRKTCTIYAEEVGAETLEKVIVVDKLIKAINSKFKDELYKPARHKQIYTYEGSTYVKNGRKHGPITKVIVPGWFVYWVVKSSWSERRCNVREYKAAVQDS